MTNVTDASDKVFIGREACIDLNIISDNFPIEGETQVQPQTTLTRRSDGISAFTCDNNLTADCSCTQRQLPSPLPITTTVNFLNIRTPKKFVVITLKFKLCASTIE